MEENSDVSWSGVRLTDDNKVMEKNVLNRQSLLDVSVQRLGSVESVFNLCERNDKSITDDLVAGESLEMPEAGDKRTADLYESNGYQPATGITTEEMNTITGDGEGIEFWFVEYDFFAS